MLSFFEGYVEGHSEKNPYVADSETPHVHTQRRTHKDTHTKIHSSAEMILASI